MRNNNVEKAQKFWNWFTSNGEHIFNFPDRDNVDALSDFSAQLELYSKEVLYGFGGEPNKEGKQILEFSPNGRSEIIPLVDILVDTAPVLSKWVVSGYFSRNKINWIGPDTSSVNELWFEYSCENQLAVTIYYRSNDLKDYVNSSQSEQEFFNSEIQGVVRRVIGEYDLMTTPIDFFYKELPENPCEIGLIPIGLLAKIFDISKPYINMKVNKLALKNLDSLWEKSRAYQPFVRDGILNATSWCRSPLKIMFLMKESYQKADWYLISGNPIRVRDSNRKYKVIWRNILRWKRAIESTSYNDLSSYVANNHYTDVRPLDINDGEIDDISYVNVSKELGASTSNQKFIRDRAEEDKEFLAKQIDLINPDVILCCKTFWAYHIAHHPSDDFKQIADNVYEHKGRVIIDFYHPGAPGGNKEIELSEKLVKILTPESVQRALAKLNDNVSILG